MLCFSNVLVCVSFYSDAVVCVSNDGRIHAQDTKPAIIISLYFIVRSAVGVSMSGATQLQPINAS